MKVLVVGTGAREHAIADALKDDVELYCYMSKVNPGISKIAEFAQGDEGEIEKVAKFAVDNNIDMAFIGPEAPLGKGIVDELEKNGISCVGPSQSAARIETDKSFMRKLFEDYDIEGSLVYKVFDNYDDVSAFLDDFDRDVVVKPVGLTGPGILNISSEISRNTDYNILDNGDIELDEVLSVDLCPDVNQEELRVKFTNDFQDKGKTFIKNYLKYFLTNNFIKFFLEHLEIDEETQLSRINKKQKNKLIESLKNFKFEISGFNKDLSHVTLGGINIENINPKTMESTITDDLYFAGEVLEPVGPTGGYNLKIAFSTGYLAGLSASKE